MADDEERMLALHRDAAGNGLLYGPDCPDCGRDATARYRCTGCDDEFLVPGRFRWFWQGRGHWHVPYDDVAWKKVITHHLETHPRGTAVVIPVNGGDRP